MNAKLAEGKTALNVIFLAVELVYRRFAPDDYKGLDDFKHMQTFVERVLTQADNHYTDVEIEARESGTLNYTSPTLYIMRLADEGRASVVEPVTRAILASDKVDDAIKAECVELWTNVTETYLDVYRKIAQIETEKRAQFFIIEDMKTWHAIHTLMPPDWPAEILDISKQMKAIIDRFNVRMQSVAKRVNELNISFVPGPPAVLQGPNGPFIP